jgi:hypothetical protein
MWTNILQILNLIYIVYFFSNTLDSLNSIPFSNINKNWLEKVGVFSLKFGRNTLTSFHQFLEGICLKRKKIKLLGDKTKLKWESQP